MDLKLEFMKHSGGNGVCASDGLAHTDWSRRLNIYASHPSLILLLIM